MTQKEYSDNLRVNSNSCLLVTMYRHCPMFIFDLETIYHVAGCKFVKRQTNHCDPS